LSAGAPLAELTALPQTPSWILGGLLLRGRERDERERKGKGGKGEGRKEKGREGKGGEGRER